MKMSTLQRWLFGLLLVTAPLSTSCIWRQAYAGEVEVGWGTVALFATQPLVLAVVVLGVIAGHGDISWLSDRRLRHLDRAGMLLLAVAAVSTLLSGAPLALVPLAWLGLGWLLCRSVVRLEGLPSTAAVALSVGGLLQSTFGLWQFIVQQTTGNKWLGLAEHLPWIAGTSVVETGAGRWLRVYGTTPHPNSLGVYLALASLAAAWLVTHWSGRRRLLALLLLGLNLLGLTLTFSRSALLGFLVGLIILTALSWRNRPKIRWPVVVSASLVSLVFLAAVAGPLHELWLPRLTAVGRLESQSVESRLDQVGLVSRLLAERSWFGVGPGQAVEAVKRVSPGQPVWSYQPIHNLPLLILVEIGLLGLLAWLNLLGRITAAGFRSLSRQPSAVLPLVLLSALLAAALFDHFLWSSWFGQLLFWLTVGLLLSDFLKERRLT